MFIYKIHLCGMCSSKLEMMQDVCQCCYKLKMFREISWIIGIYEAFKMK